MASLDPNAPEVDRTPEPGDGSVTPDVGSTPSQGRGSKSKEIATAGIAVAIIGVAGGVIYQNLPEEVSRIRPANVQAAVVQAAAALQPAVVDETPDPADVKTRVVVIDGGKDGAAPIIALANPTGNKEWEVEQKMVSTLLLRELVRQALLIAARDEMGLGTRDEVLDDVPPGAEGRDVGELSTMIRLDKNRGVFRGVEGENAGVLWKDALGGNPDSSKFTQELITKAEAYSRNEFPALLKKLGLKGEPNKIQGDAPLPDGVAEKLEGLGTVDVFAAVRALHAAIRTDGESAVRLAALSRAYAQLGALTLYQWSPAHNIFNARAMLYAERVVARDPESTWALWNRAFVRAVLGYHFLAIEDLDEVKERNAKSKTPEPAPDWVETVDAYVNDDVARLAAVKGPYARLALLLRMTSLEFPFQSRIGVHAAQDVIKADPNCDRAYDVVCQNGDLGDLHKMTVIAPQAFGVSLPGKLKSLPGLPATVLEKFSDPAEEPNAIAALADAGKPGVDRGEPSWGVLAHLVREARFVHVFRRLHFMARQWNVPVDEFWEQARPWVAQHRFLPYLEFLVDPRNEYPRFVKFVDDFDLNDVEISERRFYDSMYQIQHPKCLYLSNAMTRHGGMTVRNRSETLSTTSTHHTMHARILHNVSPHSKYAMAGLIAHDWDNVKKEVPAWRAEAGESPALLGALGKKYAELKQYKEAEDCLTRYVAQSSDLWAYQALAGCYQSEGDDDRWKATLDTYLDKTENAGLDHAKVQVQLADWFMGKDQWDKAKAYAEAAAQTGAGWAMLRAGMANEGSRDWERAEFWYTQAAERYPASASMQLFEFELRNPGARPDAEQPDADELKAQLTALAGSPDAIKNGHAGFIHWLNGSDREALDAFDAAYQADPQVHLAAGLMLVADELGDMKQRDAALDDLATKLKDKSPKTCAIFTLFRDSLADGGKTPLDLKAVEAILDTLPSQSRGNTEFFVGRYLLNRGQTEEAKKHLQRCADSPTGYSWPRAIAAKTLREANIEEK